MLLRKLMVEFNGYLKYKETSNMIIAKKVKYWKRRISIAIPIVYAITEYNDINISKNVQKKAKIFLQKIKKEIRNVNLIDKIFSNVLHKIILRYKKKYYQPDFIIPQKTTKTIYNNTN